MLSLFDEGPPPRCPEPFNMAAHVLTCAATCPDKIGLQIVGAAQVESWRFGDILSAVLGTGTGLLASGLAPGDIVLMRLGNTVEFPLAYLGALAVGLVPVPTSTALTEAEVKVITDTVRPKAVLQSEGVSCPAHPRILSTDALVRFRSLPPASYHLGPADRMGYIVFTSGTSGRPRAVAHAHRAIWARRMMFEDWYGLRQSDRLLHAGAFNWTYTLGTGLMDPWTCGATALITAPGTQASDLTALVHDHDITMFAAAPGVYRQMLKNTLQTEFPHLRHGLSAGEKLPQATREAWERVTGRPLYEAYGMSECSTFISSGPGHPAQKGALGRPQKGRKVALVGADGPVPVGTEGTIAIDRSDPGLMLGYLHADSETRSRMQGNWFLTGDQGRMDAQGQITYLGRRDDMMNAGGFRVSPVEVESVLAQVPGVSAVAVTEVSVKKDTQVIAAFYTGPQRLDDSALADYVNHTLARYKQPRLYIHVPELPTGPNGKILRRVLRAGFEARND
jgi:acyl-coenzyme A synthetase/AMP-(fatty) acid ligase